MSLGASSVYVDGIMSAKLKRILKIIFGIYTRQQLDFFKVKLECQKYIYIIYIHMICAQIYLTLKNLTLRSLF